MPRTSRLPPSQGAASRESGRSPGPAPGLPLRLLRSENNGAALRASSASELCSSSPPGRLPLAEKIRPPGQRGVSARPPDLSPRAEYRGWGEVGWGCGPQPGRGTGRASRCAQLAARRPPDPRSISLPNTHTREIRRALPPGIHRGSGTSALLRGGTALTSVPHIWPLPRLPPGAPPAMRFSPEQTTTQLWSPPAPRFCQMRTLSFKIPGS